MFKQVQENLYLIDRYSSTDLMKFSYLFEKLQNEKFYHVYCKSDFKRETRFKPGVGVLAAELGQIFSTPNRNKPTREIKCFEAIYICIVEKARMSKS